MTPSKTPSQASFGGFLTKSKSYDERLQYIQDCVALGLDFHSEKPPKFYVPALWFILSTGDEIGEQLFWRCVDDMNIDLKSGGKLAADILGAAACYGTYHSFLQEWHRRGLPFSFSDNSNPLGHSISSVRSGVSTMEKLISYGASFLDKHAIYGWDDQTFRTNHSTIVTICPEIPIWALAIQTGNLKSLELMLQTMTSEQLNIALNNPIPNIHCRNFSNNDFFYANPGPNKSADADAWFTAAISSSYPSIQSYLWRNIFPLFNSTNQSNILKKISTELLDKKTVGHDFVLSLDGFEILSNTYPQSTLQYTIDTLSNLPCPPPVLNFSGEFPLPLFITSLKFLIRTKQTHVLNQLDNATQARILTNILCCDHKLFKPFQFLCTDSTIFFKSLRSLFSATGSVPTITTSTSAASCCAITTHLSTLLKNKPLSKSQTALILKPISFSRFYTHALLISAFCSSGVMQYDDVLHTMHLLKNKSLNSDPLQLHAMSCAQFNKFYSTLERASLISKIPNKTPFSSVQTAL
jgi:hypothetical protein